jgi:hypothetical protein
MSNFSEKVSAFFKYELRRDLDAPPFKKGGR